MSELFKKEIVIEELYLEKGGTVRVIEDLDARASERYKVTALGSYMPQESGATIKDAIGKLLTQLNRKVDNKAKIIHSQRNVVKSSIKDLKRLNGNIEEIKRFLNE